MFPVGLSLRTLQLIFNALIVVVTVVQVELPECARIFVCLLFAVFFFIEYKSLVLHFTSSISISESLFRETGPLHYVRFFFFFFILYCSNSSHTSCAVFFLLFRTHNVLLRASFTMYKYIILRKFNVYINR